MLIRTALLHCNQGLDKDKLNEELGLIDSGYLGDVGIMIESLHVGIAGFR
ncbi:hypothetical protein IW492_10905 [Enterococcus sp. BWB1-3]|nr:hypothetical protein [Enterococcus sp. BWB1-3]MBL1229740.1 hypothetical protein [Enterococcus sp. BWB1-3]